MWLVMIQRMVWYGGSNLDLALDIITAPAAGGIQLQDIFAVTVDGTRRIHSGQFHQTKLELEAMTQETVKSFRLSSWF